jgi:hypothetical protein
MATQPPSDEQVTEFERTIDHAAASVLSKFAWLGLPEGTQLEDLHVELGDAIGKVLKEWL